MEESKERKEQYKERLKTIIGKKLQTVMIFPLSQFELAFGHIWGNNKPEESLTEDEKVNRQKWKDCRNNILNLGNTQKRNAFAELDMYDVVWNRYQTILIPVNRGK